MLIHRPIRPAALVVGLLMLLSAPVSHADPAQWAAEGWHRTDFSRTRVAWREIVSGGPPKDGIPAIDQPIFKPVAEITDLAPNDPVMGVEIAGDARAYPLRVLIWHEIANDTVGGLPVAVTYCPLCNSALVFERRVGARTLDFGTTGKLRNSDLVMYDRQTETWWQQFTGEAIVGELAGANLKLVPARFESFAEFKARHPSGRVLVPNDPRMRDYGRNPYVGYDWGAAPFLYKGDYPKGIEAMARVVVIRDGAGPPRVVAHDLVRTKGKLTVGTFELAWTPGQSSALHTSEIAKGRDVGTISVVALGSGGERRPVPYDVTFAFVAHAFHPEVEIIK
jgi:hypothetical protein